jgi:hypothetical protein
MARNGDVDKMSYAELADMEAQIARLKVEKHNAARVELREKLTGMAKQQGFDIHELFGKGQKGKGRGKVLPRWLAAATKGGKAKKEDFLIG